MTHWLQSVSPPRGTFFEVMIQDIQAINENVLTAVVIESRYLPIFQKALNLPIDLHQKTPYPTENLKKDVLVMCESNGFLRRAQVREIYAISQTAIIRFIDVGNSKLVALTSLYKPTQEMEKMKTLAVNTLITVENFEQQLKTGKKIWIQIIGSNTKENYYHAIHMPDSLGFPFILSKEKMDIKLLQFFEGNQAALCRVLNTPKEKELTIPIDSNEIKVITDSPGEGCWVFALHANFWRRARLIGWSDLSLQLPHLVYLIDEGKMCFSKQLAILPATHKEPLMHAFVIVFDKPYLGLTIEEASSLKFDILSIINEKNAIESKINNYLSPFTPCIPCELYQGETKLGFVRAQTFSGFLESFDLHYWQENIIDGSIVVIKSFEEDLIAISPIWTYKYTSLFDAMANECPFKLCTTILENDDIFLAYNMDDDMFFRAKYIAEECEVLDSEVIKVKDIDTGKFHHVLRSQLRELNRFLRTCPIYLTYIELSSLPDLYTIFQYPKAASILTDCCNNETEFILNYEENSFKTVELVYQTNPNKTLNAVLLQVLSEDNEGKAANTDNLLTPPPTPTVKNIVQKNSQISETKTIKHSEILKLLILNRTKVLYNSKSEDIKQFENENANTENSVNEISLTNYQVDEENQSIEKPNLDTGFKIEAENYNDPCDMFGKLKRPFGLPFFKDMNGSIIKPDLTKTTPNYKKIPNDAVNKFHSPEYNRHNKSETEREVTKYFDACGQIKRPSFSNEKNVTTELSPKFSKENGENDQSVINTSLKLPNQDKPNKFKTPKTERPSNIKAEDKEYLNICGKIKRPVFMDKELLNNKLNETSTVDVNENFEQSNENNLEESLQENSLLQDDVESFQGPDNYNGSIHGENPVQHYTENVRAIPKNLPIEKSNNKKKAQGTPILKDESDSTFTYTDKLLQYNENERARSHIIRKLSMYTENENAVIRKRGSLIDLLKSVESSKDSKENQNDNIGNVTIEASKIDELNFNKLSLNDDKCKPEISSVAKVKLTTPKRFMLNDLEKVPISEGESIPLLTLCATSLKGNQEITAADNTQNKAFKHMDEIIKINTYARNINNGLEGYQPVYHEICLAIFDVDKNWYRAVCLSAKIPPNGFLLKFIDYGNVAVVSQENIKPITAKLMFPIICNDCKIQGLNETQLALLESAYIEDQVLECDVKFNKIDDIYEIKINNFNIVISELI